MTFLFEEKMRFNFFLNILNVLISLTDFVKLLRIETLWYFTECFWYLVRAWNLGTLENDLVLC